MAVELAAAYVSLIASAKGISKSVTSELSPVVSAAGKTGDAAGKELAGGIKGGLSQVAKVAGGLFAFDKIKDFFASANDEARESQKVNALTAQVIKSTGAAAGISADQVGDLATAISNYAGIDDEAVQAGANMLLTFKNIKNAAGENNDIFSQATALVTDMSVAFGQDMKSSAIQLGKALNDPVKGITALSRVGVTFTKQQQDQIKALVKSGKTMEAQKLIIAELNSEFGGAAKAAATGPEKLAVAWGNFKESVGTALIPLMDKIADKLASWIPWLSKNVGLLAKIGVGLAGLLILSKITKAVKGFAEAFKVLNVVMKANPILLIISLIALLVTGFITLWNKSESFRNFWIGLWNKIKAIVSTVVDWIVDAWNSVVDFLAALPGRIWNWLQDLWTNVVNAATGVKDWIVARWNDVVTFISGIPAVIWGWLSGLWDQVVAAATGVKDWIVARWNDVVSFIAGIPGRIWDWLKGMWDRVTAAVSTAIEWIKGVWNGFVDFFAGIGDAIWNGVSWVFDKVSAALSFIKETLNEILGIHSGQLSNQFQDVINRQRAGSVGGTPMTRRAGGGMLPNGLTMLGENGPELADKTGATVRITSAPQTRNRAGDTGTVVTGPLVQIAGPVTIRSDQDITDLARQLARETNRAQRAAGTNVALSGALR